ncbi:hypothetical protein BDZ89DRAFT_1059489 [Hymenopellis radicata]|nr:hypothetical protein BDZ89DRAFT_1059489 [Hymenopellis radicata]
MRAAMDAGRQKITASVVSSAITAGVSAIATGVAITGIALSMDNEEAVAKYAVPGDEYWVSFCLC